MGNHDSKQIPEQLPEASTRRDVIEGLSCRHHGRQPLSRPADETDMSNHSTAVRLESGRSENPAEVVV